MTTNFSSNTTYNEYFQPCSFSAPARFSDLKILNGLLHCLLIGAGWLKVLSLWARIFGDVLVTIFREMSEPMLEFPNILPPMFCNMCLHPYFLAPPMNRSIKVPDKNLRGAPAMFFSTKNLPCWSEIWSVSAWRCLFQTKKTPMEEISNRTHWMDP